MSTRPRYMAVQGAALIVAVALTVLGVLGFIPGVAADGLLFGVFAVSVLLNIVHVVIGIAGFALARTYAAARAYLLGGGLIYLGLWLYGLLTEGGSDARVLPLNGADDWLLGGLGAVMLLLAVTLAGQHDPTKRRQRRVHRRATSH